MTIRTLAAGLVLVSFTTVAVLAVDGRKAQYVGGTVTTIPEKAEGPLDTRNDVAIVFAPDKKGIAPLSIPYTAITGIEYGQKAGRRVGTAVGTSLLLGPVGLVSLFSKKRKHYMTLAYTDPDGKEQAVVLELGKDIVRTTLTIVETRSGKPVEYQDEEARKASRGGN